MCPNYKNKKVFSEFNEIVTSLGGRAMTEDEFKDSALRNQRTGLDYQAMESAYKIWDLNGGYAIDYTKDGKPSILFETLLSLHNGDRVAAIRSKSQVYSKQFRDWFGDWINDPSEASKVVDENGEPRVVYAGYRDENFDIFDTKRKGIIGQTMGQGSYFSPRKQTAEQYTFGQPNKIKKVFLNIRNPWKSETNKTAKWTSIDTISDELEAQGYDGTWITRKQYRNFAETRGWPILQDLNDDGTIIELLDEIVVYNPNQIKSAIENVGTFSTTDNNMYHNISKILDKYNNPFEVMDAMSSIGTSVYSDLLAGKTVSSKDIISNTRNTNVYRGTNVMLAEILQAHDVPVRLQSGMNYGILASTITDNNGGSVIIINKDWINKVSKNYFGETMLHEVIHAITADALVNPKTHEQKVFKHSTESVYKLLRKAVKNNVHLLLDINTCGYALSKPQEFVSVFLTSETARESFFNLAKELDVENSKTILGKFKKLINDSVRLLVNKTVFKSNLEKLTDYQNYMHAYLRNQAPIKRGNIGSNSELMQVYKSIDNQTIENESVIDRMIAITRASDAYQTNNLEIEAHFKNFIFNKKASGNKSYDDIRNALASGILAVKSSRLNESVKQNLLGSLQTQLDMLNNPNISNYQAVSNIVRTMVPRVMQALDEIRAIDNLDYVDANNSDYMYYMHDNIGMYSSIMKSLNASFTNDLECERLIAQNNELSNSDITMDDVVNMKNTVSNLAGTIETAEALLKNVLNRASLNSLQKIMEQSGAVDGIESLHKLNSDDTVIEDDISWFQVQFGQADASSNEIIRAVAHLIAKANDNVDKKLINKAIKLLKLQSKLSSKKDVLKLYEFYQGKATGYLVRDLNFGAFEQQYRSAMKKINKRYGLAEDNTQAPDQEDIRVQWNNDRNAWLNKHCERKYTKKYYDAWAKVSSDTKAKLDGINGSIKAILEQYNVVDENGHYHYERVKNASKEDWDTLQHLWITKKLLSSDYNEYGELKQDTELKIARELQTLYKDLYGDEYKEREKSIEKWTEARNKIIDECGGQEQYDLYKQGKPNAFDFKKLDDWDSVNSKVVFKKNKEGKALVFDMIEQAMQGISIQYGEEYEKLKEQAKELLRPYYDLAGEVNEEFLPQSVKNLLNNVIYKRMAEIRKNVVKTHPGYDKIQSKYKQLFTEYLKLVDTRYYKQIQQNITNELFDTFGTFDFELYNLQLSNYGFIEEFDGMMDISPYKWLQRIEAKDFDYMELVPNNGWQQQEEDSSLLNDKYDSSYNTTMVPKRSLYDNSSAYNLVKNEQSPLGALYKEVIATMQESNALQTNRHWTNEYRLPSITGGLFEKLKRAPFFKKLGVFLKWLTESLGFTGEISVFGKTIKRKADQDRLAEQAGYSTESDTNTSENETEQLDYARISGTHPDGRVYSSLPQCYTRRLDNPEDISYQLLDIVLSYYKMSVNYNEKLQIRDQCEMLTDFVKDQVYKNSWLYTPGKKVKQIYADVRGRKYVEDSNTYKQLRNLLDFGLYGKVKKQIDTKFLSISIAFKTIQQYTSAVNLGWNKKVAVVGFLTAMHAHILNGLLGKEYSASTLIPAAYETLRHVCSNLKYGAGQSNKSEDLLQCILEDFGIANQLERKITNTGRGVISKFILNNHTFGYLATIDYLSKSQISISCLKDYKIIDGEIYSSLDIKYLQHNQQKYRYLMSKYKNAPSVYSQLKVKDGKLTIADQYRQAWDKNYSRIKAKCVKQSERADGVATGLQRAAIQQSWIGMFMMIHRQYLPLMMYERWGDRVYDYDTQEYKNSTFKTVFKYLKELAYNSTIPGTLGMGAFGWLFGGPWGAAIGSVAGLGIRAVGKHKGKNKSVKQINKEFFKDFSDQKSTVNSVENKFAVKQVCYENLMRALMVYLVIQPICNYADDDKDNSFLQMLSYWLKASQFEITGPYNTEDLVSTIKSPTASTSVLDKVNALTHTTTDYFILNLLQSLSLIEETEQEKLIGKNSAYQGHSKLFKAIMQMLPWHNEFEQDSAIGNRNKRHYLERQQMHEKAGSNSNVYKWLYDNFYK